MISDCNINHVLCVYNLSSSPALLDSKLVALGPHQTRFVEQSQLVTCILCQEEQAYNVDSKAMVLAAFIQRSTVFSKNRAKIIQDPGMEPDPLSLVRYVSGGWIRLYIRCTEFLKAAISYIWVC